MSPKGPSEAVRYVPITVIRLRNVYSNHTPPWSSVLPQSIISHSWHFRSLQDFRTKRCVSLSFTRVKFSKMYLNVVIHTYQFQLEQPKLPPYCGFLAATSWPVLNVVLSRPPDGLFFKVTHGAWRTAPSLQEHLRVMVVSYRTSWIEYWHRHITLPPDKVHYLYQVCVSQVLAQPWWLLGYRWQRRRVALRENQRVM